MEIERARITFRDGGCSRDRAQNISRLTFEYLSEMPEVRAVPYGNQRIASVETPPLRLQLSLTSDYAAARAAARHILRAVAKAAGPKDGHI